MLSLEVLLLLLITLLYYLLFVSFFPSFYIYHPFIFLSPTLSLSCSLCFSSFASLSMFHIPSRHYTSDAHCDVIVTVTAHEVTSVCNCKLRYHQHRHRRLRHIVSNRSLQRNLVRTFSSSVSPASSNGFGHVPSSSSAVLSVPLRPPPQPPLALHISPFAGAPASTTDFLTIPASVFMSKGEPGPSARGFGLFRVKISFPRRLGRRRSPDPQPQQRHEEDLLHPACSTPR